jgi:hypothetical protein
MATTKVPAEFLADNTISGTIIADNAITAVHIATNAVSGILIADNAVTTVHIAENNVTSTSIVQNAITATQIATNAINTLQIADVQVTSAKIANNAILTQHIDDNQVGSDQLADNSVTAAQIADGSITATQLGANSVTLAKMASLTRGSVLIGNSSADVTALAIGSNDYVLTSDGTDLAWEAASSFDADAAQVFNESGADVDFRVESNNKTHMLFVDGGTDNVGIGTTPADAGSTTRLHIADAASTAILQLTGAGVGTGATDGFHVAADDNGDAYLRNYENGNMFFYTNAAEVMRIAANGNVGIGRTPESYGSNRYVNIQADSSGAAVLNIQGNTTSGGKLTLIGGTSTGQVGTESNHALIFSTNQVERMRLLAGGGLTFNGDTAAANALDDYEEGNFTPQWVCSGGTAPSSNTGTGQYTKIGDTVTITGQITWSSTGSGGSNLHIVLPFACLSDARGGIAVGLQSGVSHSAGHALYLVPEVNDTKIYVVEVEPNAPSHTHLTYSNISTGGSNIFSFGGSYQTG